MEPVKKKSLKQYFTTPLICIYVILFIGLIISISMLVSAITRPKPDYDKFKVAMTYCVDNNPVISGIQIQENDMFKIVVNDSWYAANEISKLRFCESLYSTLWTYAKQYNLIVKDTENVFLNIYDEYGIKVAEQDWTDFKILY